MSPLTGRNTEVNVVWTKVSQNSNPATLVCHIGQRRLQILLLKHTYASSQGVHCGTHIGPRAKLVVPSWAQ